MPLLLAAVPEQGSLSCWELGGVQRGSETGRKNAGEWGCSQIVKSADYYEKCKLCSMFCRQWEATHQKVVMVGVVGNRNADREKERFLVFLLLISVRRISMKASGS